MINLLGMVLFTNVLLPTEVIGGPDITVTARIEPARTIVVDSDREIVRLISNTSINVVPSVVSSDNLDTNIELSEDILDDYVFLTNEYDFTYPGFYDIKPKNFFKRLFYYLTDSFELPKLSVKRNLFANV